TLTIWGANFTPSGTVWIGSTAVNYQGSGGGLISVTVPFSLPSGIYNLYVTGQAVQNTNTVQVSILSYSTQPSITVTSPNGGETWRVGETKTITWNTSGYDSNAKVRISLFDNFNPSISWLPVNPEWQAGTGIPNTGVYSWVVPATIANPGGNNEQIPITGVHRIFITISGNVNGILYGSQDYSDNYFTISATTANCTRNPSMCQGESSCYRGNCVANNRINIVCNPGQKIGDVDGDGQILENDATLNANIAVRNIASPSNICCADTTQNGTLSGLDSSYIGQMVSGIITSPGVCATNPANG
ncbi:hypothetical protein KKB40_00835, partial [Patescibacteria group bacterium]|nr:hypothetical protein [Patescibacteria group bacterium]